MTGQSFDVIALADAGAPHPGPAVATARAGGIGLLDLAFCDDAVHAAASFNKLLAGTAGRVGLRVTAPTTTVAQALLDGADDRELVVLLAADALADAGALNLLPSQHVWAEVQCADGLADLPAATEALVARGHECGGWVGSDTSYILLQKLVGAADKPIYVHGGIGVHTAAACRVAGAAGVVLADQLLLLPESPLDDATKDELGRLNGSETRLYGELLGAPCRIYAGRSNPLLTEAEEATRAAEAGDLSIADWRVRMQTLVGWQGERLRPLGQDIGLARSLVTRCGRTGRVIQAIMADSAQAIAQAAESRHLAADAPLAASHGTRYPLAQGPMTRVSDSAEFAHAVADNGALPFLALALMRGEQVDALLAQTSERMGSLPWGVGLLGFVPQQLREEQIAQIWKHKPPFALIAGGRPDQAAEFEQRGIPAYIHAPAPALLRMYLEQGARRFVFEGRECGGHIGPLASFPLWEQMIDVLLTDVAAEDAENIHLLFAGGVHDDLSGAMLAALTAPLAARGMKVGALMGSAYLFTDEIVATGATVAGFREQALACEHTVGLETGPGHSTRCSDTTFARQFHDRRRDLLREGASADAIRDELEALNLGRLRMAAKGCMRDADGQLADYDGEQQVSDGMYMIGQVATLHRDVFTLADLHESVSDGAQARLDQWLEAAMPAAAPEAAPCDVAIIGVGMIVPGADSVEAYWDNVLQGVNTITEVPRSRWDWELYYDPDPTARDKVYSKWGGFIDETVFDPFKFGIPPMSMKVIDPMQLLSLEVCSRALADAGMADGNFDRDNTSVILGAGGGVGDLGMQYGVRSELPRFVENPDDGAWDRLPEWNQESFSGSLQNVAAGRVANRLDLGGINFTVDAACGSSLAAVTLATQELESGRSNVAIAGGVDTVNGPFGFLCFSKTRALSPTGTPRTFDRDADGIVISEGAVAIVMKRLADAERDGDRVYAVIRAAAGSSDGKALGMTAPRPDGQMRALDRAYAKAGLTPADIGLLEAHGTGTQVGDRAEAETITRVLRQHEVAPHSVALGSVKSILGHTKCAAGVSGLVKVAMALRNRTLPAHIGVDNPIDTIAAEDAPVYLPKEPRPWLTKDGRPRRGAVSAFGFGGTNFHVVLEEYRDEFTARDVAGSAQWPAELCVLRAIDRKALATEIDALAQALTPELDVSLAELAFGLARDAMQQAGQSAALVVVTDSLAGLRDGLQAAAAHLSDDRALPPNVRLSEQVPTTPPRIAFLLPGQGSQYLNMGREPAVYLDDFRDAMALADRVLAADIEPALSRIVWPESLYDAAGEAAQKQRLTDTRHTQPALGTLEIGYLRLARRLGLQADAAAGHSYGEYAALLAAGVIDEASLLTLSATRGRAMAEAGSSGTPGGMAAVRVERETLEPRLAPFDGVKIANHNAPQESVISGPKERVEAAVKALADDGISATLLPVSGAFHTELVAAAQTPLSEAINATPFQAPNHAVYSNTLGAAYPDEPEAIRDLLNRHMLSPVAFVDEINAMYADGVRLFVELGPKAVVSRMAAATLADHDDASYVALDQRGGSLAGLLTGVGELVLAGAELQLDTLFTTRDIVPCSRAELAQRQKAAPPKTAWMISGGCARPIDDPLHRSGKQPPLNLADKQEAIRNAETAQAAAAASHAATPTAQPAVATTTQPAAPANGVPTAPNVVPTGSQEALLAYHETMRQFLALQERVMAQYLGAERGAETGATPGAGQVTAAPQPVAPAVPAQPTPEVATPDVSVATPAPEPEPEAAPTPATVDYRALLLATVVDLTGYPAEMIDAEADLEADLGIDSIKRVEILGSFRKQMPAAISDAMQAEMERFTAAKSVAAILAALESSDVAVTETAPHNPAVSTNDVDARGLLMATVVELTGYPEEMIEVDVDLEADLGIDSIKRVEILGAFRKQLPEAVGEAMQADMERFTAAKSVSAVLAALDAIGGLTATTAAATPAPEPADGDGAGLADLNLKAMLTATVAELTGYPEEMIDADANMEADLGIDSIKRVEILGAFRKQLPVAVGEAMQADMERFTAAKSVSALLAEMNALGAAPPTTAVTVAPAAEAIESVQTTVNGDGPDALPRFVIRSAPMPLEGGTVAPEGLVLVAGAADETRDALIQQLKAGDATPVVIEAMTAENIADEVATTVAEHGPVRGIISLHGLVPARTETLADWQADGERCVLTLFHLIKAAGDDIATARVFAASRLGGSLSRETSGAGSPLAGGAAGLLKCLAHEYPNAVVRQVDFNGQTPTSVADLLYAEYGRDDSLTECGYTGDARHGPVTAAEPLTETPFAPGLEVDADWVILATGGARGITADILARMAVPGTTLVLVGRSPEPPPEDPALAGIDDGAQIKRALMEQSRAAGEQIKPIELEQRFKAAMGAREIRANLERLRATGATVEYHAADVRDEAEFGGVIDDVYTRHGRIDAVLHGAGVIEDRYLADKTPESFARVLSTKVDSAWILAHKLRPETLRLACFFTSVAGRYGNAGQADYAAANEAVARLAWQLSRDWADTRVMAINWGPWDAGMVTEGVKRQFGERGLVAIPIAAGADYFVRELALGARRDVELVAGQGPWADERVRAAAAHAGPALPLIRSKLNMGSGGALVLKQHLSIESDPYLADHKLDDNPVLPATGAAEWIAQAVAAGWPDWQIAEIRDLRVLAGVVLDPKTGADIEIRLRASSHSGVGEQIVDADIHQSGRRAASYRASVRLVERLDAPPKHDGAALTSEPVAMDTAYGDYLFHGPYFQLLQQIDACTPDGVDATASPSVVGEWLPSAEGAWLLDPGLLDCGPQLATVWTRKHHDTTALPSAFGSIRRYGREPLIGPLRLLFRLQANAGGDTLRYDVDYVDADGFVRLALRDVDGTATAALNRLTAS